jgi:hypothetical protein
MLIAFTYSQDQRLAKRRGISGTQTALLAMTTVRFAKGTGR